MGIIIPFKVKIQMLRGLDIFFCGAGHEMVTVDVDGKVYPCHRFIPWVTKKPAPKGDVNYQNAWKQSKCSQSRGVKYA